MKTIIMLLICNLFCSIIGQNQRSIESCFTIKKEKFFLKEYNLWALNKSYYDGKNNFLFGYILEAKRNDSLFISGKIKYLPESIICTTIYHVDDLFGKDSTHTIFSNKKGFKPLLKKYIEFKNGNIIKQSNF
jgi:hypothetical protein